MNGRVTFIKEVRESDGIGGTRKVNKELGTYFCYRYRSIPVIGSGVSAKEEWTGSRIEIAIRRNNSIPLDECLLVYQGKRYDIRFWDETDGMIRIVATQIND